MGVEQYLMKKYKLAYDGNGQIVFDPNKRCKVSLLGYHNKYLCAEPNGRMVCNRTARKEWETFTSIPMGNGQIGLQTYHGQYVSVVSNHSIISNRGWCKAWETFKV